MKHKIKVYKQSELVLIMIFKLLFIKAWLHFKVMREVCCMFCFQIEAWIDQMDAAFPDLVTVSAIASSYEGRTIRMMKVRIVL